MSRILVTGANGFVGRHLCTALARAEHNVTACIRRTSLLPKEWSLLLRKITIQPASELWDQEAWVSVCRGYDAVIHLAARVHVMRDTANDPWREFYQVNTEGTRSLAQSAAIAGVRRFVFLSSIKVNGDISPPGGFRPEDPPECKDPYGHSKWQAEQALLKIGQQTGMEISIVRPPLVYGPGVKGNFANLLWLISRNIPLPFGLVRNRRSLVGIQNLVDFLIRAASQPSAAGRCLFVKDGEDLSTPELVSRLGHALNKRPILLPVPVGCLRAGAKVVGASDVFDRLLSSLTLDTTTTQAILDWKAPVSIDSELQLTANWFSRNQLKV